MKTYLVTLVLAAGFSGCIKQRSDAPMPPQPEQQTWQQQAPQSATGQQSDYKSISMNLSGASLYATDLDVDKLSYELSFVSESGDKLAEVERTKLPFDATTNSAKISVKVKIGSKGKVVMAVDDGTTKYAGESPTIEVQGDTKTSVKLKKVDGGNSGDDDDDDGSADLDIDASIGDDTDEPDSSGLGRNNPDPTPDNGDTDQNSGSDTGSAGEVEYKRWEGDYSVTQMNKWKSEFEATLDAADRPFYKYTYIDKELYDDAEKVNKARVAVFKSLNHVAIKNKEIKLGKDVSDGHGVLYAFDIRDFWGDAANNKWRMVSQADQRAVSGMISAPQLGRLRRFANESLVPASRLVYNLVAPPIYVQLIDTPAYESGLQRELGFKARTCEAMAAQKDAIVYGSRVSCMRTTANGRIYWTTSDDFNGRTGNPVPYLSNRAPRDMAPMFRGNGQLNRPDAGTVVSEAWVEMENGFNAYYIWGNADQRRGRAELFVEDPDNVRANFNFHYLETGRSCITCHAQGVHAAPSDVAAAMREGQISGQRLELAKRHWTTDEELAKIYAKTRVRFLAAMTRVVSAVSDGDSEENKKLINGAGQEPILMMVKIIDRLR